MTKNTTLKLTKWGNSLGIRIPKQLARSIDAVEGTELIVKEEHKKLIIERRKVKPKYELADLLSKITPENQHAEVDWGKQIGSEVW